MWICHICGQENNPEEHALFCENCGQQRKLTKGYVLRMIVERYRVFYYTENGKWTSDDEDALLFPDSEIPAQLYSNLDFNCCTYTMIYTERV